MERSSALKKRRVLTALFTVKKATASLRSQCTATSAPTMVCGILPTPQTDPTAQVHAADDWFSLIPHCYYYRSILLYLKYLYVYIILYLAEPFLSFSVNRIANNGFKPFEMLFKASRCDDVDLVKSFAGEFKSKLGGMVRICIYTHTHRHWFAVNQLLNTRCSFSPPPQLPNICSSDDVTCKLEVLSQGHCLEYNYDYENGFSIGTMQNTPWLNFPPVFWVNVHILKFSLFNIYQHPVVGATAGVPREPRTMHTLSQALPQAPGRWPGGNKAAAYNRTSAPRGTEKSLDQPEIKRSRSFSISQVFWVWLLTFACIGYYLHNNHIMCLLFWIPAVISSQSFKLCPFPQQASLCPYRGMTQ